MYLRADTHPDGELPAFVVFTPPQLFVERHFRGWKPFQGLAFCLAGIKTGDGRRGRFSTSPPGDPVDNDALIERLRRRGLPDDVGHADMAWTPDLLMWVGKDFYTVGGFIEEAREHGVNKRIPAVGEPPPVVPGFTRLFLAHPHACEGDPGIFGYTYLTRVLYTNGSRPTPKWVDDLAARGRVDICEVGPEYDPALATPLLDGLPDGP